MPPATNNDLQEQAPEWSIHPSLSKGPLAFGMTGSESRPLPRRRKDLLVRVQVGALGTL